MIVYLDIILLLNIAIDTMLLWFTAYFRKERVRWWRIILASLFGSTYLAFFFFPVFAPMYQWSVKLLFSVMMLWIAFGHRRLLAFCHNLIIFYFVAFVFGGGVFGLQYFLSTRNEVISELVTVHNDGFGVGFTPTLAILLAGFAFMFFLSKQSYAAIQQPRRVEAVLAEVRIQLAGETVLCRGLIDTGNQLHEPITRNPVMIVEGSLLTHILPAALIGLIRQTEGGLNQMEGVWDELPLEWQSRLRLVPYRSVASGMSFLVAIKPDEVLVVQEGRRFLHKKVLVGLNPLPLAADGQYQAIVHPAMIETPTEEEYPVREQEG
ncbi:sigma-E processing peptidase SpoIIGA [Brevibacillus composti]|uniref:Sigma-E processing peptidase SpoIIGA n=1 Tax=Brevibacillus composti TaxID=2796470 RepID=A0A7T5ENM8_9BACL|nr:sigma-E processing peptidase SpoIIGA [Brevibacillus composti]QQE75907.1 sigma-E processing peptidase SpoIIGA [Brevibacillus composti]QUO42933.1 sigma-E processing peptidase SpoIIGA [Brevibacillus composti]